MNSITYPKTPPSAFYANTVREQCQPPGDADETPHCLQMHRTVPGTLPICTDWLNLVPGIKGIADQGQRPVREDSPGPITASTRTQDAHHRH